MYRFGVLIVKMEDQIQHQIEVVDRKGRTSRKALREMMESNGPETEQERVLLTDILPDIQNRETWVYEVIYLWFLILHHPGVLNQQILDNLMAGRYDKCPGFEDVQWEHFPPYIMGEEWGRGR